MLHHIDTLEPRTLLAGMNAELFQPVEEGRESRSAVIAQPLAKTPAVGGIYRGTTSKVALNGNTIPASTGLLGYFRDMKLTLKPGTKGRITGTMTWATVIMSEITKVPLAGKITGNTFVMQGSSKQSSSGVTLGNIWIKVSGQASADGQKLNGSFRVYYEKLVGTEDYTGKFQVKRSKA